LFCKVGCKLRDGSVEPKFPITLQYDFLQFLIEQKENGRKVAACGAVAKGNTLLSHCGIKKDLISFVVDVSPHKQVNTFREAVYLLLLKKKPKRRNPILY